MLYLFFCGSLGTLYVRLCAVQHAFFKFHRHVVKCRNFLSDGANLCFAKKSDSRRRAGVLRFNAT